MTTVTIKIKTDAGASVTVSEETHVLYDLPDAQAPQNGSGEARDPEEGPAPQSVDLSDWDLDEEEPHDRTRDYDWWRPLRTDAVRQPNLPSVQVTFLLPDDYLDTGDDIIAEEASRRLATIAEEYGARVLDVTIRR